MTTRRITVTCWGPPRELHPNWRGHWAPKSRAASEARKAAWAATLEACPGMALVPIAAVTLRRTFYVPDKRARDVDGLESATKNMADGIAHTLRVNDKIFRWLPSEIVVERGRREVQFDIELEVG